MNSLCKTANEKLYYRGQVDVIDMPIKLACDYKYFLVYEDRVSRFVVLEGLRENTANEVAERLLDVLAIIGAPQVLQSSNGRKFAEEVARELRLLWKDFVILHGEMSESNGERRDFKTLVESWIEENPTYTWRQALKYVQILQNTTFRCENEKVPYDVMFGRNVHEELKKRTVASRETIWAEEEWINLRANEKNDVNTEDDNRQLTGNSAVTSIKYEDSLNEFESEDSSDLTHEDSDKLQGDTPEFKFVNVKSEPLNVHTEEDSLYEDQYGTDDKIELIEEDQSNLKCKVCQKQYMKPGHLKNHMKTHTKRKKFDCKLCNKTFHVLSLYEKHMRQSHRQNKLSTLTRSRRSKESQDETAMDTRASKLRCSSDSNLDEAYESRKDRGKLITDNRSMKINGEPALKCSYCNQKFSFPSVLKRHMRSHTNERPYICEVCNKSFKQLGHLSQHTLTHKDYRSFHCAVCGIKFDSLSSLKIHAQEHKEGYVSNAKDAFRLYECDNCKKVFATKSVLERHILTHSHERQFPCLICGKRFKQAGHVKSHMLVHTGERKFECSICQRRFSLSNSLKKHMYVHNGEKPYQCDVCGARFLEKRNLNGHLMTHTNERPFRCKVCGKRYTLADTLRRHVSAAHEDGRTYQCEICAKMFKQLAHLSVHKKVHNDERPFQCHLCEKNFKHKNVLKSHLAIHANVRPFECDVCKATFVRKTNLQTHIASAHMNERPYVCTICGKRFKQISHLNGHVVVHSNLMPYQCDFCDRRCNRLDNLKKHMRLHKKNQEQTV